MPSNEESVLGDDDDALAELVRARGGDTNEAAPENPDANLAGALSLISSSNSGKRKSAISSLLQMGFSNAKPSDYALEYRDLLLHLILQVQKELDSLIRSFPMADSLT